MLPSFHEKISTPFKKAAGASVLALAAGCATVPETVQIVPFTKGETELVEGIFGKDVNVSKVTKIFHSDERKEVFALTTAKKDKAVPSKDKAVPSAPVYTIDFYGTKFQSADFSREKDPSNYSLFAHEMTHIWQFQTLDWNKINLCPKEVSYSLDNSSRFSDYCHEKQAAIVEDYARLFLHPDRKPCRP